MFKVGDKVLFSLAGDNQVPLKSETGIILKVNESDCAILRMSIHINNIYNDVPINKITHIRNRDQVEDEIINHYNDKINALKNKLQFVTDEMKKDGKVEKYEKLKQQIKKTAKNLYEAEDDSRFENRLKAICELKKELYTIELDCISVIRKHNGGIWYEISVVEGDKRVRLKNISEETILKVFNKL